MLLPEVGLLGFFLSEAMLAEVGLSKVLMGARTSYFFLVAGAGLVLEPILPIIFIS